MNSKADFRIWRNVKISFTYLLQYLSIDDDLIDENLKRTLIEIQRDSILMQKYTNVGIPHFYNYLLIGFPCIFSILGAPRWQTSLTCLI